VKVEATGEEVTEEEVTEAEIMEEVTATAMRAEVILPAHPEEEEVDQIAAVDGMATLKDIQRLHKKAGLIAKKQISPALYKKGD
jgi:hypothetical protein